MRVVVLGAGLAGMCAAERLASAAEVTVLEKESYVGGLASSFEVDGEWIPKHYHHVVASNTHTISLLKRFGCKDSVWQRIKVVIGTQGKTYNIQKPLQLLRLPGCSLWGKFRFGLFGLYTIFLMNPDNIPDGMNAKEWLYKYCGKEATDFFWWNLYGRNKFNIPLDQIAAKQFAHRLWEKEVYDKFTFPREGLEPMLQGLRTSLEDKKVDLRLKSGIARVDVKKKLVILKSGEEIPYDVLVNTIPVPELLKVQKGFPKDYVERLSKLRYCPAVGMCFATEDWLLPGVYWINLFGERVHVVMQHSVLADKYRHKVSWLIRYGGSEEDLGKSDEEIERLYFGTLRKFFPAMKVKWRRIFREKYAEPVYDKDYVRYAPGYESPVEGLFHAGIQVTFPKIRNQNVAIESGYRVADIIRKKYDI